jgi:hypothetical protein
MICTILILRFSGSWIKIIVVINKFIVHTKKDSTENSPDIW